MLKNLRGKYLGESAMILVTLFWGATFVIVKESLNDISSMLFIAFRFTIAGILFIPFIIRKKIKFTAPAVIPGGLLGLLIFMQITVTGILSFITAFFFRGFRC